MGLDVKKDVMYELEGGCKPMRRLAYHLLPVIVPLACITISIALYPDFSFMRNALSDLGHAKKATALIFNFGLVTGGLLLALRSQQIRLKMTSRSLTLTSYFLTLVGTFDEIYGRFHYIVSVLFFLGLILTSFTFSWESGRKYPAVLGVLSTLTWLLHFSGVKWGVAVPESISIALAVPWYLDLTNYLENCQE